MITFSMSATEIKGTPEDKEKLPKIIQEHKEWLEDHSKGRQACLKDMNLEGVDLSGIDLSYADLSGSFLLAAKMVETKLTGANLERVCLNNADLTRADLNGAQISGAKMMHAHFEEASMKSAIIQGSTMWDSNFKGANLIGAILTRSQLCDCIFESAALAVGFFSAAFDDRILTKSNHMVMLMMGKNKKTIIYIAEDKVLNIDQKDIEQYLSEVKEAVEKDNYRLDRNARRQDNINLFLDYVIDEAKAKEIILSLTAMDFSEILQNDHKGFENEKLYVFGKDVTLLERNGTEEKTVSLYVKFNKLENCFVIFISFHEQKYPLTYYFR